MGVNELLVPLLSNNYATRNKNTSLRTRFSGGKGGIRIPPSLRTLRVCFAKGARWKIKTRLAGRAFLAGREGFEPSVDTRPTTVFETVPFNHSGTFPNILLRAVLYPNSRALTARSLATIRRWNVKRDNKLPADFAASIFPSAPRQGQLRRGRGRSSSPYLLR
jgi:hypothetical protein